MLAPTYEAAIAAMDAAAPPAPPVPSEAKEEPARRGQAGEPVTEDVTPPASKPSLFQSALYFFGAPKPPAGEDKTSEQPAPKVRAPHRFALMNYTRSEPLSNTSSVASVSPGPHPHAFSGRALRKSVLWCRPGLCQCRIRTGLYVPA